MKNLLLALLLFLSSAYCSLCFPENTLKHQQRPILLQTLTTTKEATHYKFEYGSPHNIYRGKYGFIPVSGIKTTVKESIKKINPDEIAAFVANIRANICKFIKNGSIKLWVTIGGKAGGIIVSAHANTGMEIVIRCDQHNP